MSTVGSINPFLLGWYSPLPPTDATSLRMMTKALKKGNLPALTECYQSLSCPAQQQLERICCQLTEQNVSHSMVGFSAQLKQFCASINDYFFETLLNTLDIAKAQQTAHKHFKKSFYDLPGEIIADIIQWIAPWERRAVALTCHSWYRYALQLTRNDIEIQATAAALSQEIKQLKKSLPLNTFTNPFLFSGIRVVLKDTLSISQLCSFRTRWLEKTIWRIVHSANMADIRRVNCFYRSHKKRFPLLRPLLESVRRVSVCENYWKDRKFFKILIRNNCLGRCMDKIDPYKYIKSIPIICQTKLQPTQVDRLLHLAAKNSLIAPKLISDLLSETQIKHKQQFNSILPLLKDVPYSTQMHFFFFLSKDLKLSSIQINALLDYIHAAMLHTEPIETARRYIECFPIMENLCRAPHLQLEQMHRIFEHLRFWNHLNPEAFCLNTDIPPYRVFEFIEIISGKKLSITDLSLSNYWIEGCGVYKCTRVNYWLKRVYIHIPNHNHSIKIYWFLYRKCIRALNDNPAVSQEWVQPFQHNLTLNENWVFKDYLEEEKRVFAHLEVET